MPLTKTATPADEPPRANTVAAVDLGSNSFHMIVARVDNGHLVLVDRLREMVRLAAGLNERGELEGEAVERALACLERFGQRLRHQHPDSVRVVGTNTLRKARNAAGFLQRAEAALGHSIDIISGLEEARLIYEGVAHSLAEGGERRFVMDIGGGSTELIVGQGFEPMHMESLYMGCVSMTNNYFADGNLNRKRWRQADLAARVELEPHEAVFRRLGWTQAVGASGTIRAVARVVQQQGWCEDGIDAAALKKLVEAIIDAGQIDKLRLAGLGPERRPVFAGGVVVLAATFDALGITHMDVADGALREGLIYDLIGRIRHEDVRSRTVLRLAERFGLDRDQGARVETTALHLLRQVEQNWALQAENHEMLLRWAAQLHELGLFVAHNQHHKHGAYLLENADLPGFSRQDQRCLAALVRGHRRKFPLAVYTALPPSCALPLMRLVRLLRLAVVLHRSRSPMPLPGLRLSAEGDKLTLGFEPGWLDTHPLTQADLEQEASCTQVAGFDLAFA
ncbi:MAG: exopolyphosphatase [Gammaproteobacteria bacterium SG8_47]|nr:MAG: exopolyphosphatase [Gammaproteobacteria bacterium SG8_47]